MENNVKENKEESREKEEEQKTDKPEKKKKKLTTWYALDSLKFRLKDYKELKKNRLIKGKKKDPNRVTFNSNYKDCLEIAGSESFQWRPEDYIVRKLGEGISYSVNTIVKDVVSKMSRAGNKAKVSKREVLKFISNMDDIECVGTDFKQYLIKKEHVEKLKPILVEKDICREKAAKYFIAKTKKKAKVKESSKGS